MCIVSCMYVDKWFIPCKGNAEYNNLHPWSRPKDQKTVMVHVKLQEVTLKRLISMLPIAQKLYVGA